MEKLNIVYKLNINFFFSPAAAVRISQAIRENDVTSKPMENQL